MKFKTTHDSAEDEIMTNNILQLDAILEPTILNKSKRFVQLHCSNIVGKLQLHKKPIVFGCYNVDTWYIYIC